MNKQMAADQELRIAIQSWLDETFAEARTKSYSSLVSVQESIADRLEELAFIVVKNWKKKPTR